MTRDKGLEALINDELDSVSGLTEKAMFGGWAWLLHGNLLCGARDDRHARPPRQGPGRLGAGHRRRDTDVLRQPADAGLGSRCTERHGRRRHPSRVARSGTRVRACAAAQVNLAGTRRARAAMRNAECGNVENADGFVLVSWPCHGHLSGALPHEVADDAPRPIRVEHRRHGLGGGVTSLETGSVLEDDVVARWRPGRVLRGCRLLQRA